MLNRRILAILSPMKLIAPIIGFLLIITPFADSSVLLSGENSAPFLGLQQVISRSVDMDDCAVSKQCNGGTNKNPVQMRGETGAADGAGANARFNHPKGIAVDKSGNLYVADTLNATIRKITSDGVVSTVAGIVGNRGSTDGLGRIARFDIPTGIAVDTKGNLYIADSMNGAIRKITPGGVVSTLAGMPGTKGATADRDGKGSEARFDYPNGIVVDGEDNLYFITPVKVCKITPNGQVITLAGEAADGSEDPRNDGSGSSIRFNSLTGITVDTHHNLFVADGGNQTIRKISPAGEITTIAGLPLHPGSGDGLGASARFKDLRGITIDSKGNLLVADTGNHAIRKITPDGRVTTLAGVAYAYGNIDGAGTAARFIAPYGLASDAAGNVYVTDTASQTIRKITQTGVTRTMAGAAVTTPR